MALQYLPGSPGITGLEGEMRNLWHWRLFSVEPTTEKAKRYLASELKPPIRIEEPPPPSSIIDAACLAERLILPKDE